MDSWAFEQLNRLLTPEHSPQNGPDAEAERSASSLSFPVSGSDLQAQLEAWTNAAFDFETIVPPGKEGLNGSFGSSNAPVGPSFGIDNYALGLADTSFTGLLDDPLSLQQQRRDDPYGNDLYAAPTALPNFAPASAIAPQPAAAPLSRKLSSAAPAKKRRQSVSVGSSASPASDVVAATPATPQGDDELNAVAIEEDKRRRNTAASARFRVKKKQREAALESTAKELRDKVNSLEKEVDALRTENGWLRGLIVGKEEAERKAKEEESSAQPVAA